MQNSSCFAKFEQIPSKIKTPFGTCLDFKLRLSFAQTAYVVYRHSFLGHIMLELAVLIHKKLNDKKSSRKKSLIVSKTVQSVPTQEDNFWQVFLLYISPSI